MSTDIRRQAWAAGRYVLVDELRFVTRLWLIYALGAAVFVAVAASRDAIPGSVWAEAVVVPKWFALVWGIYQTAVYVPLFVAHGYTRREFAIHGARIAAAFAVWLGALVAVGFALEWLAYEALGRPQMLRERYLLFDSPTQFPLILAQFSLVIFAWIMIGALCGAAFYRFRHWAVPVVPAGIVMLVLIESATGSGRVLLGALRRVSVSSPEWLAGAGAELELAGGIAGAAYVLTVAAALALTWLLIRDLPLRTKHN